jgi:hypothetical protein
VCVSVCVRVCVCVFAPCSLFPVAPRVREWPTWRPGSTACNKMANKPFCCGDFVLFFLTFFQSLYLVIQVSDCYHKKRTMVLQTVLVVRMFSFLLPRSRFDNACTPRTSTKEPQAPSRATVVQFHWNKPFSSFSPFLNPCTLVM